MPDTTATDPVFTEEQRAEWRAASDRSTAAHEAYLAAQTDAGSWLVHAIEDPSGAAFAREKADELARDAIHLRDEWQRAVGAARRTPYGEWLNAQIDERLARRRAEKAAA